MRSRFCAYWRLKVWLTVVLNVLFWAGYGVLGRHASFPIRQPPVLWPDTAIPFQPEPWGWIYLSQFLFTGPLPWLIATRDGLRRYVKGFVVMSVTSFAIFFFCPVASPRPADLAADGPMAVILTYDGTLNAFPSLHASFLVYTAWLAWRMFGRVTPVALGALTLGWGGAILYATLATRQHYTIDLLAGAAIGALAGGWAWRGADEDNAAATTARNKSVASHDGCR